MLAVPLRYQGQSIGVYNLFISSEETRESSITDEDAVLQSIGKHLGMAVEQAGVEDNARQLSSLITHFRAPIDGKGVVRTIESIVEKFHRETGLMCFSIITGT